MERLSDEQYKKMKAALEKYESSKIDTSSIPQVVWADEVASWEAPPSAFAKTAPNPHVITVPDPGKVVEADTDIQVVWVEKGVIKRNFTMNDLVFLVGADIRNCATTEKTLEMASEYMTLLTQVIMEASEKARREGD